MQEHNGMPVDHAGDGVYVLVDGHGVTLHANHHAQPTDKIYIEDAVMDAILRIRDNGRAYIKHKENRTIVVKEIHKKNYDKLPDNRIIPT